MVAPKTTDRRVTPIGNKKDEAVAPQKQKKAKDVALKEKKKVDEGAEKAGASGTTKYRHWKMPSQSQINVTSIIIGEEKLHMIIVEIDPYTFHNPLPLLYYTIKRNKLIESTEEDIGKGSFQRAKQENGKKGPTTIGIHKNGRTPPNPRRR
ncbi:hypothetical protein L3Y34_002190 [Caenorhabditis briggsae]|uniref:Uncharacterized protein n=1 Tax=Caenorhabditis briggsae TaxID=6238 RepID=A0AAE9DE54_CAEBR|nr:hypothetical protein L3Y34_002190 [Caenorhabditis briggsae]